MIFSGGMVRPFCRKTVPSNAPHSPISTLFSALMGFYFSHSILCFFLLSFLPVTSLLVPESIAPLRAFFKLRFARSLSKTNEPPLCRHQPKLLFMP